MTLRSNLLGVGLVVAVIGGGCAPVKMARETAKVTRESVDEYDQATAAVQEAEQKFYDDLADAIHEARKLELRTGLTNSRLLAAKRYTDYLAAKPVERTTKTELFDFLLKATNEEQDLLDRLREQAEAARTSVLDRVETFEKRSKEIDAVKKQLDELSTDRSPLDTGKFLADFFEGIKRAISGDQKAPK